MTKNNMADGAWSINQFLKEWGYIPRSCPAGFDEQVQEQAEKGDRN